MAQTMVLVAVLKFMFAAQHTSSIILLATSETRTLSLVGPGPSGGGLPRGGEHYDHHGDVLTLGLAMVARSFGLKVGIRAE